MTLRNLYEVDLGTSGLILRAESREEILADKLVALAFRENRLKNRDLWDIAWLTQRGVEMPVDLVPKKISDHGWTRDEFAHSLTDRIDYLETVEARTNFLKEMRRFLPSATVEQTLQNEDYWQWLRGVVVDLSRLVL
jgi:predicted nucleotidyltransferase component of viral defense system